MKKKPNCAIQFCTGIPECEKMFVDKPVWYDWMETVYGTPVEEVKECAPVPKGKMVQMSSLFDANLMHDMVMGRSCTGILEFLNWTPIDWFSKRQN